MKTTSVKYKRPAILGLWAFFLVVLALGLPSVPTSSGASSGAYDRVLERKEQVAPDVLYYEFRNDFQVLNYNLLRVNWRNKFLLPRTILGDGTLAGLETVSQQAAEASDPSRYVVAAVNGDFYDADGHTTGVLVVDEEIVSSGYRSNRDAFIIGDRGRPTIDTLVIDGEIRDAQRRKVAINGVNTPRGSGKVVIYTPRLGDNAPAGESGTEVVLKILTSSMSRKGKWGLRLGVGYEARVEKVRVGRTGSPIPDDGAVLSASGTAATTLASWKTGQRIKFRMRVAKGPDVIWSAIGGWPVLVENHKNIRPQTGEPRHPRTAIGYNDKEIMVVTVDGRRAGWSKGMTTYELGNLMVDAGCKGAINVDGGGSTEMWVRGKVKNMPSDGHERPVAMGFAIFSSAPKAGLGMLVVDPPILHILTDTELQFAVSGHDKFHNPVPIDSGSIRWTESGNIGRVNGYGTFVSGNEDADGFVTVTNGSLKTDVEVHVYREPPAFNINTNNQHLFEGETYQFKYISISRGNPARRVVADYDRRLRWNVTPGVGSIDHGLFTAGNTAGAGYVTVSMGALTRQARVTVGTVPKILDGFEVAQPWSFRSHPDNSLKGSFTLRKDAAHNGATGGALRYVFDKRSGTEACYAKSYLPIAAPLRIGLWVKGDGSDHELRVAIFDRNNERFTLSFPDNPLKSTTWREVMVKIPGEAEPPLRFESVYVLRNPEETKSTGMIFIDDLTGHYAPE